MTKVYANNEVIGLVDAQLVEAVERICSLREENYHQYVLAYKQLCNIIRNMVEMDNVIQIGLIDEETVAVITYNVIADDLDMFTAGEDEYGYYIEV